MPGAIDFALQAQEILWLDEGRIFGNLFGTMRHLHQTLLMWGMLLSSTQAQQIDFHFQLLQADAAIADALQSRLMDGGEPADQAMSKIPDFVRQRRVSLEAELKVQTPSGQRARGASTQKRIEVDDEWEV
ncbi:MAG: hypothetical protein AAF191_05575, partial [Verrucomicrobiota bacterium]